MLIANKVPGFHDHLSVIRSQLRNVICLDLAISYVKLSGMNQIRDELAHLPKGKCRVICTFSMGVTEPAAIRQLINGGAVVKFCNPPVGTFHSKIWIFETKEAKCATCLIGSANLTAGGFADNLEIGMLLNDGQTVARARAYFNFLWGGPYSELVNDSILDLMESEAEKRRQIKKRVRKIKTSGGKRSVSVVLSESYDLMFDFVRRWIDLGPDKEVKSGKKIVSRLWRGWYLIPDHGMVDDDLMIRLSRICHVVANQPGNLLAVSKDDEHSEPMTNVLQIISEKFIRPCHKMSPRDLFIRQEKNYLRQFLFADHPLNKSGKPDQRVISLTALGQNFACADGVESMKAVYTEAISRHQWNGLAILDFARLVLEDLGHLDLAEFSYFVCHAYSMDELGIVIELVWMRRWMDDAQREKFDAQVNVHFGTTLELTAKNVRGNYDKNVRHTMSALGWCRGFSYDPETGILSLSDH